MITCGRLEKERKSREQETELPAQLPAFAWILGCGIEWMFTSLVGLHLQVSCFFLFLEKERMDSAREGRLFAPLSPARCLLPWPRDDAGQPGPRVIWSEIAAI